MFLYETIEHIQKSFFESAQYFFHKFAQDLVIPKRTFPKVLNKNTGLQAIHFNYGMPCGQKILTFKGIFCCRQS